MQVQQVKERSKAFVNLFRQHKGMNMELKTFKGGLHPPDNKKWSNQKAIEVCPLAEGDELVIHLSQHIGAPAEACVQKGDKVLKGQVIGTPKGFVSVPIHASTSGEVIAVEPRLDTAGNKTMAVVIKADGKDEWDPSLSGADPDKLMPQELKDRILAAGIVGMGGATFPTHVKLSPPEGKKIDYLILNGVECEPYLTADHRLMLEKPEEVVDGVLILKRILGVENAVIGIEANKPDAIEVMQKACEGKGIEVCPLQVKYPQGAEKQLIYAVTKREVPSGGLPMDCGCVVQNVGTAAAVNAAVRRGIPLIERIATVSGSAIAEPKNLLIKIGQPISKLVEFCGGVKGELGKIIQGGPMMGMAAVSMDVPVTRGTSGILLFSEGEVIREPEGPCVRCGNCVRACPAFIMPTEIAFQMRRGKVDEAEKLNVMDCIECGSCTYICPAQIPLLQFFRQAKSAIRANIAKRKKV